MWKEKNNELQRTFVFDDFVQAFGFMTEIAFHAEKMNHHPWWANVWNTVEVHLTTHDAGNTITDKDKKFAQIIDDIYVRRVKK